MRFSTARIVLLSLALLAIMPGCRSSTRPEPPPARPEFRAGLRASSYGLQPFPQVDWWLNATGDMAARFAGAQPAVIWIVGVMGDDETCWLNFPAPDENTQPEQIVFSYSDFNEAYLQRFDEQGIRVWLQVEPAQADLPTLIDLVLSRYSRHPSVVGLGVDVEWYRQNEYPDGKAVTDEEAHAWVEQVRRHNPAYRLFLKHWLPEKMPPTYRDGVTFVDDSQQFATLGQLVDEFTTWGQTFAPAPVGFQFGYPADRVWWQALEQPPTAIGQALREAIPNVTDLYWVDFTARELWP